MAPGSFSLEKLWQMAIYCAKGDYSNDAWGNYFFDRCVTLWGHIFLPYPEVKHEIKHTFNQTALTCHKASHFYEFSPVNI